MIEIEIQNETHQSHERIKMAVMPRIGEGLRLQEPDGFWASYDILDLWYQKADYGDIWVPYLHVRMTPAEDEVVPPQDFMAEQRAVNAGGSRVGHGAGNGGVLPFAIS